MNDSHRLEFARLWEDLGFGPERADFVRAQINMARIGFEHPAWLRLASGCSRAFSMHGQNWNPDWYQRERVSPSYHRGFIECVTVRYETLLNPDLRRRLFETAPVQHVNVIGLEQGETLNEFLHNIEDVYAQRIRSLDLTSQELDDNALLELCRSRLRNLRWLSLSHNRITRRGVSALLEASATGPLSELEHVDLEGCSGDPRERLSFDQGQLVFSSRSAFGQRMLAEFPTVKWLSYSQLKADRFAI